MGLSLRFLLPLSLALGLLTIASMRLVDGWVERWSLRDLDTRADLISAVIAPGVESEAARAATPDGRHRLDTFITRAAAHERVLALGLCDATGRLLAASADYPANLGCRADNGNGAQSKGTYVALRPLPSGAGSLAIALDASYLTARYAQIRRSVFYFFSVLSLVISLVTVAIAQLSWRGWVSGMRRALRKRDFISRRRLRLVDPEIRPIARDLRKLVRELEQEKAERESHLFPLSRRWAAP